VSQKPLVWYFDNQEEPHYALEEKQGAVLVTFQIDQPAAPYPSGVDRPALNKPGQEMYYGS
jgi:hypothetical protein